jgi:hypothetical protein
MNSDSGTPRDRKAPIGPLRSQGAAAGSLRASLPVTPLPMAPHVASAIRLPIQGKMLKPHSQAVGTGDAPADRFAQAMSSRPAAHLIKAIQLKHLPQASRLEICGNASTPIRSTAVRPVVQAANAPAAAVQIGPQAAAVQNGAPAAAAQNGAKDAAVPLAVAKKSTAKPPPRNAKKPAVDAKEGESDPEFLYHAAPAKFFDSIAKYGLQMRSGGGAYLCMSSEVAGATTLSPRANDVIFAVAFANLERSKWNRTGAGQKEWRGKENIDAQHLWCSRYINCVDWQTIQNYKKAPQAKK